MVHVPGMDAMDATLEDPGAASVSSSASPAQTQGRFTTGDSPAADADTTDSDAAVLRQCPPAAPRCWGPLQWSALHQLLRGYPQQPSEKTQQDLRQYVTALAGLIPCSICATHWADIAPTVDTSSRFAALKWSIDVHNAVNKRLGKPVLTYAQAVDHLTGMCSGPGHAYTPPAKYVAGLTTQRAVLIAIAVLLFLAVVALAVVVGVTRCSPKA
jgi:hypothetical protein